MKKGDIIEIKDELYIIIEDYSKMYIALHEDDLLSNKPYIILEGITDIKVVGNVIEALKLAYNIVLSKTFLWFMANYDSNNVMNIDFIYNVLESELSIIGKFNTYELNMVANLIECVFKGEYECKGNLTLQEMSERYLQIKNRLL